MQTIYCQINFHFEGMFCTAFLKNGKIRKVLCDEISIENISDEMEQEIYKEYHSQNN